MSTSRQSGATTSSLAPTRPPALILSSGHYRSNLGPIRSRHSRPTSARPSLGPAVFYGSDIKRQHLNSYCCSFTAETKTKPKRNSSERATAAATPSKVADKRSSIPTQSKSELAVHLGRLFKEIKIHVSINAVRSSRSSWLPPPPPGLGRRSTRRRFLPCPRRMP